MGRVGLVYHPAYLEHDMGGGIRSLRNAFGLFCLDWSLPGRCLGSPALSLKWQLRIGSPASMRSPIFNDWKAERLQRDMPL